MLELLIRGIKFMDFNFLEKNDRGISIIAENENYFIFVPKYVYEKIDNNKLNNWICEISGIIINKNDENIEIKVPMNILPSDIYSNYYTFIE